MPNSSPGTPCAGPTTEVGGRRRRGERRARIRAWRPLPPKTVTESSAVCEASPAGREHRYSRPLPRKFALASLRRPAFAGRRALSTTPFRVPLRCLQPPRMLPFRPWWQRRPALRPKTKWRWMVRSASDGRRFALRICRSEIRRRRRKEPALPGFAHGCYRALDVRPGHRPAGSNPGFTRITALHRG